MKTKKIIPFTLGSLLLFLTSCSVPLLGQLPYEEIEKQNENKEVVNLDQLEKVKKELLEETSIEEIERNKNLHRDETLNSFISFFNQIKKKTNSYPTIDFLQKEKIDKSIIDILSQELTPLDLSSLDSTKYKNIEELNFYFFLFGEKELNQNNNEFSKVGEEVISHNKGLSKITSSLLTLQKLSKLLNLKIDIKRDLLKNVYEGEGVLLITSKDGNKMIGCLPIINENTKQKDFLISGDQDFFRAINSTYSNLVENICKELSVTEN